ncbi:hypothetical protein, partial [Pseudomonas sp. PM2]|uniref:hypothetical protein n=1 Tax=Pseudomonas sp. PM2 TaxID=215172 RepID=UPI003FA30A1F
AARSKPPDRAPYTVGASLLAKNMRTPRLFSINAAFLRFSRASSLLQAIRFSERAPVRYSVCRTGNQKYRRNKKLISI